MSHRFILVLISLFVLLGCSQEQSKKKDYKSTNLDVPAHVLDIMKNVESASKRYEGKRANIYLPPSVFKDDDEKRTDILKSADQAVEVTEKALKEVFKLSNAKTEIYFSEKLQLYEAALETASIKNKKIIILGTKPVNKIPYVGYAAIALAPYQEHLWLRAGFGMFINNEYGQNTQFTNYGAKIDPLTSHIFKTLPSFSSRTAKQIGDKFPELKTKEEWQVYFILSGSFVKYIYDNVGKEDFYKIYKSKKPVKTLESVTGKEFIKIRKDWESVTKLK